MSKNRQQNDDAPDRLGDSWRPSAGPGQDSGSRPLPPRRSPAPGSPIAAPTPSTMPTVQNERPMRSIGRVLLTVLLGGVLLVTSSLALAAAGNLSHGVGFAYGFLGSLTLAVLSILGLILINRKLAPPALKADSGIVGEVRGLQQRDEYQYRASQNRTSTSKVWTFRVERYDSAGNRLPPVPVEMRGNSYRGFINEGDTVQLLDKWKEGQLLQTARVRNLTTGVMVTAQSGCFTVLMLLISFPLLTLTILILSVMRG